MAATRRPSGQRFRYFGSKHDRKKTPMPEPDDKQPTDTLGFRMPFYIRIGFGLVVLFGMIGNCTGRHEQSVAVFVLVTVLWVCTRIINEAIDSYHALRLLSKVKEEETKDKDDK